MTNIIRIGDRFINLDHAHVDFGAKKFNHVTRASDPAIRIYHMLAPSGSAENFGPDYIEYTGEEMRLVAPFLARTLSDLSLRQLDLPGQRYGTPEVPVSEVVYQINEDYLEGDATRADVERMITALSARGYNVVYGPGPNHFDPIPQNVWDECQDLLR